MLLNRIAIRNLLEAATAIGVDIQELTGPFDLDVPALTSGRLRMEWGTFVELVERLSFLLGGDTDRLREVGRRMTHVPSYAVLRRVVQGAISVPALYRATDRWLTSASFPVMRVFLRSVTSERMQMHAEIPAPHAPSEAFFWISAGTIETLPELLGLPPAVMLDSRISPRVADFDLKLPTMRRRQRARSIARSLFSLRTAREVLEEQRRELSDNVEALTRARQELRGVLDRLPDAVLVHDGGTILWANRPLLAALGHERLADVVGKPIVDITAPRSRDLVRERLEHAARGERQVDRDDERPLVEVVLLGRAGHEVIMEVAPSESVVFDGHPARLVVARDVTERVLMQRRLLVADRMAAVGMLAAGVAHEVNNPLAYVLNNIELARKTLAGLGASADLARESLSVALEGVDRIRTVVRDLLLLARGERQAGHPVDVRAVAESTLALARPELEGLTRLVMELEPAPLVQATEASASQILLNLLGNALDAMRGAPRDACTLVVRVARAGDGRLLLEVSDTGRGIDARDQARVFEPFFTTKAAGEGTGLGLSIVQGLVTELGGEIGLTSAPGQGASFRVLLPPAAPRAASTRGPDEAADGGAPAAGAHPSVDAAFSPAPRRGRR